MKHVCDTFLGRRRALQCIISPHLGHLSDKYGRKPVLLATMVGNVLSAVVCVACSLQPGFGGLAKTVPKSGGYNQRRLRHFFSLVQLEVLVKGTFNYRCKDISRLGSWAWGLNVDFLRAIISDVTTQETRSRGLSLVGMAFAICFCVSQLPYAIP